MKRNKLFWVVLLFGLCFAGNPNIRVGNTGGVMGSSYESLWMEVKGQPTSTANDTVWYADNIAGLSQMGIYFTAVSSGNLPTTISALPVYSNGQAVTGAQTVTAGTALTDMKSAHYILTLPKFSATETRLITFNYLLTD